jgi:hypothetical protein
MDNRSVEFTVSFQSHSIHIIIVLGENASANLIGFWSKRAREVFLGPKVGIVVMP